MVTQREPTTFKAKLKCTIYSSGYFIASQIQDFNYKARSPVDVNQYSFMEVQVSMLIYTS